MAENVPLSLKKSANRSLLWQMAPWALAGGMVVAGLLPWADGADSKPAGKKERPSIASKIEASPQKGGKEKGKGKEGEKGRGMMAAMMDAAASEPRPIKPQKVRPGRSPVDVAEKVNQLLLIEVPSDAAKPMGKVDDEVFLRRVYLDLQGKLPTPGEITAFVLDPSETKRTDVVKKLLDTDLYAQNWGRYWRDVIMYRKTEDRAEIVSPVLQSFMEERLRENAPWSQVATEMITAVGDGEKYGATALIIAQQGKPEETVSEISRIFMGVQIQCAQCHDHPTDRWKREQFHELAAFFPRVASRVILTPDRRNVSVTASDFFNPRAVNVNNNRFRGSAEHRMPDLKNPESDGTLMTPVFFATGDKLPIGTKDIDRRGELAKWVTEKENPYFAKAYINRMWSELCGEGFCEPVDDMGPDREVLAPQTLDYLAKEFTATNYNVKWLFQVIMNTALYQAPSSPRRNAEQTPFQANVAQRKRGDQIFDNLLDVLGVSEPVTPGAGGALARRRTPRNVFNVVFGYDPSERRDEVVGSIPQALAMMNSPAISGAISGRSTQTALGRLLKEIPDDKGLVMELYLRTLGREPHASELSTCLDYVKQVGNRVEAFEDIQWSLINSTEFLHRP
ncbi:MAG: DUF1549 domain-containing protein [Pirellulales bacterium]